MMPLFDMFTKADNGAAMKALADQFALNQQQTTKALEALLPAFSEGLRRNASDPMGIGAFLQALATGNHAKYLDDTRNAFSAAGMADGNAILGHLFGNKDVSRAIARQAEAATGLGSEILKQMLPVIASMLMGGLFKQSTGQMQAAMGQGGGNIIGQILEQMMKGGLGGMPGGTQSRPQASPMDNPFGEMLEQMMRGGQAGNTGMGDNPFGQILEQMMRGNPMGMPQQRRAPEPEPEPEAARRPRNPYDDLFGQMFETGTKVQKDYQKGVQDIFDQYLRNMNRAR